MVYILYDETFELFLMSNAKRHSMDAEELQIKQDDGLVKVESPLIGIVDSVGPCIALAVLDHNLGVRYGVHDVPHSMEIVEYAKRIREDTPDPGALEVSLAGSILLGGFFDEGLSEEEIKAENKINEAYNREVEKAVREVYKDAKSINVDLGRRPMEPNSLLTYVLRIDTAKKRILTHHYDLQKYIER